MSIDIVLVSPSSATESYQELASLGLSAVEPPTWALILAGSLKAKGFNVSIIDALAESLSDEGVLARVKSLEPRVICFVVYGQNVNAGTANMAGATRTANFVKRGLPHLPLVFVGSHAQALPVETLETESDIDIVVVNEGVKALQYLCNLEEYNSASLKKVPGIFFREGGQVVGGAPPESVSQRLMDIEMPRYAWELLPFDKKPLDLYKSPLWHADYQESNRSPYAAIQTSIGCQFKCSFCMINLVNKNDLAERSNASNYTGMRFWSSELVLRELKTLYDLGVRTIRITDEMFFLNPKRYMPIVEGLGRLNYHQDLRLWAYSRIDTVPSPEVLTKIRAAGFRWLCLGIESGDRKIRLEVAKGKFEEVDVEQVVEHVEAAGINVVANYIYGLPGDTEQSIEQTYQLSAKLNTLGWNTYPAVALPGSPLFNDSNWVDVANKRYSDFAFHSYSCKPLRTKSLPAWRILQLRDQKFVEYFARPEFLEKIEKVFGEEARETVLRTSRKLLRREIIDERGQ